MGEVNCRQGLWEIKIKATFAGQSTLDELGSLPCRWGGETSLQKFSKGFLQRSWNMKIIAGSCYKFCGWPMSPVFSVPSVFYSCYSWKGIAKPCICIKPVSSFKSSWPCCSNLNFSFSDDGHLPAKMKCYFTNTLTHSSKCTWPALTSPKPLEGHSPVYGNGRIFLVYRSGVDFWARGCSSVTIWCDISPFQEPSASPLEPLRQSLRYIWRVQLDIIISVTLHIWEGVEISLLSPVHSVSSYPPLMKGRHEPYLTSKRASIFISNVRFYLISGNSELLQAVRTWFLKSICILKWFISYCAQILHLKKLYHFY